MGLSETGASHALVAGLLGRRRRVQVLFQHAIRLGNCRMRPDELVPGAWIGECVPAETGEGSPNHEPAAPSPRPPSPRPRPVHRMRRPHDQSPPPLANQRSRRAGAAPGTRPRPRIRSPRRSMTPLRGNEPKKLTYHSAIVAFGRPLCAPFPESAAAALVEGSASLTLSPRSSRPSPAHPDAGARTVSYLRAQHGRRASGSSHTVH